MVLSIMKFRIVLPRIIPRLCYIKTREPYFLSGDQWPVIKNLTALKDNMKYKR